MEEGDRALSPEKGKHAMNFYQGIAVVLLRVWAARLIFTSVWSLLMYGQLFLQELRGIESSVSVASLGGQFALAAIPTSIGFALWFLGPAVAKWVAAGITAPAPGFEFDAARLVEAGTFLIGVFYLFWTAPGFIVDLTFYFLDVLRQTDGERLGGVLHRRFSGMGDMGTKASTVAIALFLTFRARDVAKLFTWLREAGLPPAEEAAPAETKPAPGE